MDNIAPQANLDMALRLSNQQLTGGLDPWVPGPRYSQSEQSTFPPGPTAWDSESGVPASSSTFFRQLFSEQIHSIIQTADHSVDTPHSFSGLSFDDLLGIHQPQNLPNAPQEVLHQPMPVDEDLIARQFAARHRPPLVELLSEAGLEGWTFLCDMLLIRFFSDSGTQLSKPFYGWREEMYVEYITHMYDLVSRRGATHFDYKQITVQVKGSGLVEAYSCLADQNFMAALLSEDFPSVLVAYWGSVGFKLANCVLPTDKALRSEALKTLTSRTVFKGIFSHNFLHRGSSTVINYFRAPEFLFVIRRALQLPNRRKSFAGIFAMNISNDGVLTFSLLRHFNIHTISLVAALVLTGLEVLQHKKPTATSVPWVPNDKKEKKFREIHKLIAQEIREFLACRCETETISMAEQLARKSNIADLFEAAQANTTNSSDSSDSDSDMDDA